MGTENETYSKMQHLSTIVANPGETQTALIERIVKTADPRGLVDHYEKIPSPERLKIIGERAGELVKDPIRAPKIRMLEVALEINEKQIAEYHEKHRGEKNEKIIDRLVKIMRDNQDAKRAVIAEAGISDPNEQLFVEALMDRSKEKIMERDNKNKPVGVDPATSKPTPSVPNVKPESRERK